MRTNASDLPVPVTYLIVLAVQVPVWLVGGLAWAGFMVVAAGWHPASALISGLGWAFSMWLVVGNLLAVGLVWRRSAEFPAHDRAAFRAVIGRACGRLRMKVLKESPDEIVLGPQRALVRFRLQEVRVRFSGDMATVTGPALSSGVVRRSLVRASAESTESDPAGVRPSA